MRKKTQFFCLCLRPNVWFFFFFFLAVIALFSTSVFGGTNTKYWMPNSCGGIGASGESSSPPRSCKQEIQNRSLAMLSMCVLGLDLLQGEAGWGVLQRGEDGAWFLGRGQFIPLFLVCYFALLMSKCNKLWIVPVTLAGSSQWPQTVWWGRGGVWGTFSISPGRSKTNLL